MPDDDDPPGPLELALARLTPDERDRLAILLADATDLLDTAPGVCSLSADLTQLTVVVSLRAHVGGVVSLPSDWARAAGPEGPGVPVIPLELENTPTEISPPSQTVTVSAFDLSSAPDRGVLVTFEGDRVVAIEDVPPVDMEVNAPPPPSFLFARRETVYSEIPPGPAPMVDVTPPPAIEVAIVTKPAEAALRAGIEIRRQIEAIHRVPTLGLEGPDRPVLPGTPNPAKLSDLRRILQEEAELAAPPALQRRPVAPPMGAWSPEEDLLLAELYREKASPSEIEAALGRPLAQIRARWGVLNLGGLNPAEAGSLVRQLQSAVA